jgi:acyl transferase domain-containing protein
VRQTSRDLVVETPQVVVLSASTAEALERATDDLSARLAATADIELAEVARSLIEQPALEQRRVVVVSDRATAAARLREREPKHVFTGRAEPDRPVVFLFSGVGDQYAGMGLELYRHLATFRQELDRCFALLRTELGIDLHDLLYPEGVGRGRVETDGRLDLAKLFDQRGPSEEIHRTLVAQPLMFAVEYALARLLVSVGVRPSALVGYSVGEYVAACIAGVMPLEGALAVVAARARLVAATPDTGAMLAVLSDAPSLEPYVNKSVSVAALDGPQLSVLAGSLDAIAEVERRLGADGIASRRLPVSHAFHSSMMEPVVAPLERVLRSVDLQPPRLPVLSNSTGTWLGDDEATDPGYWARHLRRTIRFTDDVAEIWRLGRPLLVELGPGRALGSLAARHPARPAISPATSFSTMPGPFESHPDLKLLLTSLARLWAAGVEIDWRALERETTAGEADCEAQHPTATVSTRVERQSEL